MGSSTKVRGLTLDENPASPVIVTEERQVSGYRCNKTNRGNSENEWIFSSNC